MGNVAFRSIAVAVVPLLVASFGAAGAGCSSDAANDAFATPPETCGPGTVLEGTRCVVAGGAAGAGGEAGGEAGGGGTGAGGAGGVEVDASDGSALDSGPCVPVAVALSSAPLDVFVMLDQSGSMADNKKWDTAVAGLTAFVNDPLSAGVGVGIQYFALPPSSTSTCPTTCTTNADCAACGSFCLGNVCVGGGNYDSCDAADYAKAEVSIAPLPGNAQSIIDSLGQHSPSTGTPTSAALQGAITYAQQWEAAHPDHRTVVAFLTDGDPQECDANVSNIAAIAAQGFGAKPSIATFFVGLPGATKANLDQWAAAGGTQASYAANDGPSFVQAMNGIRAVAKPCGFAIPTLNGGLPDPNAVDVELTPSGAPSKTLPRVSSGTACVGDGWFYDAPLNPTAVVLCPASCQAYKVDPGAALDMKLGCGP